MRILITFLVLMLAAVSMVSAQTQTLVCDYPVYVDKSGAHRVKDKFVLTFIIDSAKNAAYIVGNNGSAPVRRVDGDGGLMTFIEITGAGNVMTTTITLQRESVHSRNTTLAGVLVPSQYYGKCIDK